MTSEPDLSVPAPQPNPSAALDLDQIEARLASDRLVSPVLDVLVREDVPALVAEVRRLRETLAMANYACEQANRRTAGQKKLTDKAVAERDAARAEAERLREDAYEEKRRAEQSRSAAYQRLVEDRDKYLEAWQESVAEAARVREALQAARAIHQPKPANALVDERCSICHWRSGDVWPCPTVAALDAALDGAE